MKDCVTILVMSPAASSSVGWSSGSSVVSAEGKDPTLQQPPVTTASEKAPAAGEAQKYPFYQL